MNPQSLPKQHTGAQSDTTYTITSRTEKEAEGVFAKACSNLLQVNKWQQLSGGGLSASFELIDEHGKKVYRGAQQGDYFRINIPAPGNESGHGYDWVQIEKIEKQLAANTQLVIMQVRPAQHPTEQQPDSSHFFTYDATSSFCVEKRGKVVSAAVHGRNEKPNTHTGGWFNKIRNTIIGFFAMLGMNKPQWKALVKGILEKDAETINFPT